MIFSFFFSLISLIPSCLLLGQLVSNVEQEWHWYESVRRREFNLEYCGRLQVAHLNLEEAYLFLRAENPKGEEHYFNKKSDYQTLVSSRLKRRGCKNLSKTNLRVTPYKEQNPHLPPHWPNWVLRYDRGE